MESPEYTWTCFWSNNMDPDNKPTYKLLSLFPSQQSLYDSCVDVICTWDDDSVVYAFDRKTKHLIYLNNGFDTYTFGRTPAEALSNIKFGAGVPVFFDEENETHLNINVRGDVIDTLSPPAPEDIFTDSRDPKLKAALENMFYPEIPTPLSVLAEYNVEI